MKKITISLFLVVSIATNLLSQNTCETAVDFGPINGPAQSRSINSEGEYWFSLTTTQNYLAAYFSLCGAADFDTKMEIWTACDAENYWKYNDDGNNCNDYESEIYVEELTAGTYYIKIYGYDSGEYGDFSLSITAAEVPSCETAINFGNVNGPAQNGSTIRNNAAWYYITIPEDMENILFSTCNNYTAFDTEMQIWENCDDSEPLWIGEDECNNYKSQIFVSELSAGTYYIKVFGYNSSQYGNYSLTISEYDYSQNTCETAFDYGTVNDPEQTNSIIPLGQCWYSLTTENDMENVIFSLCENSSYDTKMEIWAGCGENNYIAYNDDGDNCGNTGSEIIIQQLPAGTYYVKVYGFSSYFGQFTLSITTLQVIETIPSNNDTDIAIDAVLSVEFDARISSPDMTNITITPDPGEVSAQISNDIISINHNNFQYSTLYTVNIPSGTIRNYSGDIIFSFTTIEEPMPEATISAESWSAGNIQAGSSTNSTFTLTNTGGQTLTVSSVTDLPAPWSSTFGEPSAIELNAGETHSFELAFSPTAGGDFTENFVITTNGGTKTIALTGTGIQPIAGINPDTWNAGEIIVGNSENSGNFTLTNNGTGKLTVSSVTDLTAPWSSTFGEPSAIELNAGETHSFELAFSPTAGGDFTENFVITTNGGTKTIALTGTGIQPIAGINPDTWNAGEIIVGNSENSGNFTLTNNGTGTLTVSAITTLTSPWSSTFGDINSVSLTEGQSHTFLFTFAPVAIDNFTETFEITTNGGNVSISLNGQGIDNVDIQGFNVNSVNIYPNPSNGLVNIEVPENSFVKIVDIAGKVIESYYINGGTKVIFTQSPGVYIAHIETNNKVSSYKIIIQ